MPRKRYKRKTFTMSRRMNKKARELVLLVLIAIGYLLFTILKAPFLDGVAEYLTLTDQGQYILNTVDINNQTVDPVVINDNNPFFQTVAIAPESSENYSELDYLGRCGPAYAVLGKDLMPESDREDISSVKPSGWHNTEYPDLANACAWDQTYWANRCHLIAFALAGENAEKRNLVTGTRTMNLNMLNYEIPVIDYIRSTGNHVIYRVTPVFYGADLVARGVLMEAYSIEDNGQGIQFCVWIPNAQNCLNINYATGITNPLEAQSNE